MPALPNKDDTYVDVVDQYPDKIPQHQPDTSQQGDEIHGEQQTTEDHHLLPVETADVGMRSGVGPNDGSGLRTSSDVLYNINDLLGTRLRSDSQRRREKNKHQQMMNEWMIAAAVIDRICFIVFGFVFVIGTAVLFVVASAVER